MKSDAQEVEFYFSEAHRLKTPAVPLNDTTELVSRIERKLPNVADARQDLQSLRDLFSSQLLKATTLQAKKYPPHHLSGKAEVDPQG